MKKIWLLFTLFLILSCFTYASECDVTVDIVPEKQLFSNESIGFRFKLSNKTSDYKIEYWVEDSFGNVVKNKRNTTNLNKKSFTPKSTGLSAFTIKARFAEPNCVNISEHIVFFMGGAEEEQYCACTTKKGIEYFVVKQINEVNSGEKFFIKVNFTNYDDSSHEISVWSYVYRGSKVYSLSRKANELNFTLKPHTSRMVELPLKMSAEPGEYKIKVKIKKDNQKTEQEVKWNLVVSEKESFNGNQIRIESISFTSNPTKILIVMNNTFEKDFIGEVQLYSAYFLDKITTIIEQGDNNIVSFDVDATDYTNPFFVKLLINDSLVDVEEIILTNPGKNKEVPFTLVTGNVLLDNSSRVYESSGVKSFRMVSYLLLLLSIIVNCWFIYDKKKI